jgi:hypothetical protein
VRSHILISFFVYSNESWRWHKRGAELHLVVAY